jgi:hypothetical protein
MGDAQNRDPCFIHVPKAFQIGLGGKCAGYPAQGSNSVWQMTDALGIVPRAETVRLQDDIAPFDQPP